MTRYTLPVRNSVAKDLKKIPRDLIPAIFTRIENLQDNPLLRDAVKISGADHFYRIRAGEYRIVYQVLHENSEITVYYVRHRSIAYRTW